jgi:CelD/BcsL family acetyltransferase involved in cellulose biosynthesis
LVSSYQDDRFLAFVDNGATEMASRWDAPAEGSAMTPFQSGRWLESWYGTVGRCGGEPILLTVRDRRTQRLVAMLPLFAHRSGPLRVVRFADADVSDYNATCSALMRPSTQPAPRRCGRPSEEPSVMPTSST